MNVKQLIAVICALIFCLAMGIKSASATTDDDLNLIDASARGDLRIFKMMLEFGANPNAVDKGGNSAILVAAYYSNRDMVRRLIELDADVNVKGSIGYTVLGAAAMRRDTEILEMLINAGARLDVLDDSGGTPLANAVRFQRDEHVKMLLDAGANVNMKSEKGEPPLVLAAQLGRLDYVNALLAKVADVNLWSGDETTALYWAIYEGHDNVAQRLIQAGANAQSLVNGYTPLHWARVMDRPMVVSQLEKMGVVN